jgi:hypothetical protein
MIVNQSFLLHELGDYQCLALTMPVNETKKGREFDVTTARSYIDDCDAFFSFSEWSSRSLENLLSNCKASTVGFCQGFDYTIDSGEFVNQFDNMFRIIEFLSPALRLDTFAYPMRFPANIEAAGAEIIDRLPCDFLIGFHPEGSYIEKSCDPSDSIRIIKSLLDLNKQAVVCVFGINSALSELEDLCSRVVVFNNVPFSLGAYLVSRMKIFIGVDSSFLHVSDLARIPGIGLFGPTDCNRWGYRFAPHAHLLLLRDGKGFSVSPVVEAFNYLNESQTAYN